MKNLIKSIALKSLLLFVVTIVLLCSLLYRLLIEIFVSLMYIAECLSEEIRDYRTIVRSIMNYSE